jgi:hypothetical protein
MTSLALVAGGGWLAYAEARPYFMSGIVDSERVSTLASMQVVPGPSISSQRSLLENCVRAIRASGTRGQPGTRLRAVSENCLGIADGIAAAGPANSYAWYVAALSSYHAGDQEGAVARLIRSQETGPNEGWIAELRVGLGEVLLDALPQNGRANHDSDLRTLVASWRGIASIATAIVEGMPEPDQRRFITTLRSLADRTTAL